MPLQIEMGPRGAGSNGVGARDDCDLNQSCAVHQGELGVGLADVDYKRDERDGRIMVMEVNPRLGGIHRVGRSYDIDLVQTFYRHMTGEQVTPGRQVAGVQGQWCHLSKDLRGLLLDLKDNPARLFPWFRSYFSFPKDALFNWRDPGPWVAGLWRLVCAVCKVVWRGGRRRGARAIAGLNGVNNSLTARDE